MFMGIMIQLKFFFSFVESATSVHGEPLLHTIRNEWEMMKTCCSYINDIIRTSHDKIKFDILDIEVKTTEWFMWNDQCILRFLFWCVYIVWREVNINIRLYGFADIQNLEMTFQKQHAVWFLVIFYSIFFNFSLNNVNFFIKFKYIISLIIVFII